MLFEILAEEGLRREIEVVGDLLNAHSGILEQGLGFEDTDSSIHRAAVLPLTSFTTDERYWA